mgnify:CR=1 FL=1
MECEIVNGITVSPNSYTGDDGTVVLVGNYTFAYKVISGGNTIYYGIGTAERITKEYISIRNNRLESWIL